MPFTKLRRYLRIAIILYSNSQYSLAFVPSTATSIQTRSLTSNGSCDTSPSHTDSSFSLNFDVRAHFNKRSRPSVRLNGVNEWRDTFFDIPSPSAKDEGLLSGLDDSGIPREVTVLPFPYEDVLLQGETKQLRLYEDRFIQLFDECMEKHNGVVAMGLIADSGIIQTVPLCEVEAYNRMEGFGIFVTLRVVARGALVELKQQEPFIKAVCIEVMDNVPANLEIPNMIASNIENFMISLSSLEYKLETNSDRKRSNYDDVSDEDMKRRMIDAALDDAFYGEGNAGFDIEEEDDDDYDEDNDDDEFFDEKPDRNSQFKESFKQAQACDTQGYMISGNPKEGERSVQDLTALSWAVFCTDDVQETVRVQALDSDDLFDRLKLGSYMLREKKAELEAKLALTDVKLTDEEDDDE